MIASHQRTIIPFPLELVNYKLLFFNQVTSSLSFNPTGAKKSLLTVFRNGICHPKLAMVIDDRLKVWEDKDQPRVHVVPAFAPYYAPLAEVCVLPFQMILISSSFFLVTRD